MKRSQDLDNLRLERRQWSVITVRFIALWCESLARHSILAVLQALGWNDEIAFDEERILAHPLVDKPQALTERSMFQPHLSLSLTLTWTSTRSLAQH